MSALRRGSNGFTLIELLISMLLLAIGFLGLAAVQSKSLAETQNTQFRSKADVLLRDIADRMRANGDAVEAGRYLIDTDVDGGDGAPAECPADTGASGCLALRDLDLWMAAVDDALPDPRVVIADAGNGMQRIRIDWTEINNRASDNSTVNPCGEDMEDRTCVEMRVLINGGDAGG